MRLCARLTVASSLVVLLGPTEASAQPTIRERVDVPRIVLDVRALGSDSSPVTDLTAAHFAVSIDGRKAIVESATWVSDTVAPGDQGPQRASDTQPTEDRSWLVVLVQRKPDLSEMEGLMRIRTELLRFVERQPEQTNVAVLSFDTQLHVWLDFTTDRSRVQETLGVGVFTGNPPGVLSLRAEPQRNALSASEASAVSTIEESLIQVGRVLDGLPGAKNLLLVGYGLGTWIPRLNLVQMPTAYPAALDALRRARVSAFCIDITRADYHPREEGLVRVATESGGLYWQSHIFTASVFEKLEKVISGRYVLSIVPPDDRRGEHTIRIRLIGRKGEVLAPRQYIQN